MMIDMSMMTAANTILARSFEQKRPISLMKLQRILYVVSSEHAKATGQGFVERFGVWKYGPSLSSVHYKFSCFGARDIEKFAKDSLGRSFAIADSVILATFDKVWAETRDVSAVMLSRILTQPGSAWHDAKQEGLGYIPEAAVAQDTSYKMLLGL